jgi:predicted phage terminase large subunit-like protein
MSEALLQHASKEKLANVVREAIKNPQDYEKLRLKLRHKAQRDLWFFCYHVCGFEDIANPLHMEMCERFQKRIKKRFSLYLVPRSHLKTTLWTVGATLWEVVQDWVTLPGGKQKRGQDLRYLIVNAKLDNAIDILRDIKSIITTNEMFGWLFPEYVPDESWQRGRGKGKWTDDRIDFPNSKQAGRKEGNIEVMSVGASLVSKHYDVMKFDDPVNDENSTTKPYRDRIYSWYRNALQLRNDPISSRIVLIGTRWHYDDLYGRVITRELAQRERSREEGKPVKPVYYLYRRKAIESGTPIWPERFTYDELMWLKNEELGSYIYSCQYDNDPVPEEDAHFKRSDINWIDDLDIPMNVYNFAAVDMADEETTRGDFTVITIASFDDTGKMYIREIMRGKYSNHEILQLIHRATERWNLQRVGIETTGFQKGIVRGYKHEADRNGWYIPWMEVARGKTTKLKRGLGLQPRVERGDFYIVEGIKNSDWLIEEMTTFPLGVYDDILDTVVDIENIYYSAPHMEAPQKVNKDFQYYFGDITESEDDIEDFLSVDYLVDVA